MQLGSGELFVLQHGRFNELHQCIAEQIRIMTIVEPKFHFVEVGREVLCRHLMPRSNDPAFEQRKRRFNSVRRNITLNVNLRPG